MITNKHILSFVRRAVDDYDMISEGDHVAVGISAGKDSLTLLCALAALRRFYPKKFTLCAITIDMGFKEGMDFSPIAKLCEELEVPYHIIPTQISHVIFDIRAEKNPCALCAKMRRGALNNAAKSLGCNKVALGHHFDDAVVTFMLNLFFEGRIGCFSPVTYLSRADITVIRPLIYMPERNARYFATRANLPVVTSPCPADGNTERAEMETLLSQLERGNRGLRYRIFGAMQRGNIDGFKELRPLQGIKVYANDEPDEEADDEPTVKPNKGPGPQR